MAIVYLCKTDPLPHSDFPKVIKYFDGIPKYLQYSTGQNRLLFADRIGENWPVETYTAVVAFISKRFIEDVNAMQCFSYAVHSIKSTMCIALDDSLTSEALEKLQEYTRNIYSAKEGIDALICTFPNPNAEEEEQKANLEVAIENDGYSFLDNTIGGLNSKTKNNRRVALIFYFISFLFLCSILIFSLYRYFNLLIYPTNAQELIAFCIEIATISALTISISRLFFLLGKSFMVESIRCADRAHAIGLGKLYLQLYKSKFEWRELKDIFQNWNIDKGSAFIKQDAKDIVGIGVDGIISALRNKL